MKTSELTGAALDWAVAKCEGEGDLAWAQYRDAFAYSSTWVCGGPIMEREGIGATVVSAGYDNERWLGANFNGTFVEYGQTCLVACMRTYVASKLGDEIEIPEELK